MKFQVHKNELLVAVNNLTKLTATQNQIDVYKNIQFDVVDETTLKMSASNGNNTLVYYAGVLLAEGESILINAKDFLSVINKLDGLIEFDNGKITCGKSVLKLPYIKEKFLKDIEIDKAEAVKFDIADFKKAVKNRLYAASDENYNNILSCLCLQDNEIVATNGNVLTIGAIAYDKEQLLLDKLFISNIVSCMDADFNLITQKNQIIAFNEKCIVMTMQKNGQYPKYKQLIPHHEKSFSVDKQRFINVLELLQVILTDRNRIIILEAENNTLSVSVEGEEKQGKSIIDIDYAYEPLKIAFNVDLLLNCCKNVSDDTLIVEFNQSLSPTVIKGESDFNIIMPIQMRNIS